ncbi:hypothetical protein MSAN_00543000 [Mycena sanguinolenta]|uniref:Uncharacterized protein n=1 Tax=Mycena sanguinolenta TaxID=230812 RepID=A0A8H6Z997_9AGAR|nr:hypothetical protein MSAN_00543000 [Mycena sanguinolenta]
MPRGRPRLPPEVKQEHVLRSRKKYEEKNVEKRREDARLRMQRKRAKIEDDLRLKYAYRHKAAQASARYRRRKEEREWVEYKAAHAENRHAHKVEADSEDLRRRKHPSQAEELITSTPVPAKKKARIFHPSPTSRKEPQHQPLSRPALTRNLGPRALPRKHAESPRRLSDIAQDDDEHHDMSSNSESESVKAHLSPPPVFEQRVICNEGCPGCACMCEESTIWIQHEGGHFFPTCKKCGEDDCPGPDPGHEDRDVHDKSPRELYYAIVSKYWSGVVSSSETIARELKRDPNARTFVGPTWQAAMDWWRDDCLYHHNHHEDSALESSPESSPCSSISEIFPCSSISAALVHGQASRSVSSDSHRVASQTREIVTPDTPRSVSPLKIMARHTPSPTKAIGKRGISPTPAPRMASISQFPDAMRSRRKEVHTTEYVASKFESWIEAGKSEEKPRLLYGVSGHNRIFQDWDQAMAALKSIPSAELMFSHDEADVWNFVRAEADRMLIQKESQL